MVILLASDLDGTLVPPERSPERHAEVRAFRVAVEEAGVRLAYVTGRHVAYAIEGVRTFDLPLPEFLACDVGTSLYRRSGDAFEPDPDYQAVMAAAFGGADAAAVRRALEAVDGLRLQEPPKQAEHKASYYTAWPVPGGLVGAVESRLAEAGLDAGLVISRDPVSGTGLLDVLPAGVGKDRALLHLIGVLGLHREEVLFAGDSGNDRAAFLSGCRAVVVGNAPAELVEEVRTEAARAGLGGRVYFARARYAAGVLEGCRHFGVTP